MDSFFEVELAMSIAGRFIGILTVEVEARDGRDACDVAVELATLAVIPQCKLEVNGVKKIDDVYL